MESKSNKQKSNQLAFILSGFYPGLGQFYNEDWKKGCAFFVANFILEPILLPEGWWEILRGRIPFSYGLVARTILFFSFRIWAVFDADRSVKKKNAAALSAVSKVEQ